MLRNLNSTRQIWLGTMEVHQIVITFWSMWTEFAHQMSNGLDKKKLRNLLLLSYVDICQNEWWLLQAGEIGRENRCANSNPYLISDINN